MKKIVQKRTIFMVLCIALCLFLAACGKNNSAAGTEGNADTSKGETVKAPSNLMKKGTLTLGVDPTYPPLESYDDKKNLVGFDIELGAALAKEMGLEVKWVDSRFDGLIPSLNSNKFDAIISGITVTEERAKVVDFIPYFSSGMSMIGLKESALKIKDEYDVDGLKMAVLSGSIQDVQMRETVVPKLQSDGKKVTVNSYPSNPEAVLQVSKRTADLFFLDSPVAKELVVQFPELEIVSPVLNPKDRGIVTRKGDKEMQTALEAALQKVIDSGTLDKMLEKVGLDPRLQ